MVAFIYPKRIAIMAGMPEINEIVNYYEHLGYKVVCTMFELKEFRYIVEMENII